MSHWQMKANWQGRAGISLTTLVRICRKLEVNGLPASLSIVKRVWSTNTEGADEEKKSLFMINTLKVLAATQMHEVDCFAIITVRKKEQVTFKL